MLLQRIITNRTPITSRILLILVLQLGFTACSSASSAPEITPLQNLRSDLSLSEQTGRPVLVVFSTTHCSYCQQAKEEFIRPILRNKAYDERVIIRLVEVDDEMDVIMPGGESINYHALTARYGINFYPTVIFLGRGGEEVAKRLVGIATVDLYGGYLDRAIDQGMQRLRAAP